MYLENFPKKLKKLRLAYNLTQSDLANILHTTKQAISSYESGKATPSLISLIRISEYFNISLDSLVFDNNNSSVNLLNSDIDLVVELLNIRSKIDLILDNFSKEKQLNCKSKILDEEYSDELSPDIIALNDYKKEIIYREVPDYGCIPAGKLSLTFEDYVEFISIPEHNLCSYKDYYVLHISGDSMNKLYDDGETILVEKTSDIYPSDIVIARINDKATVKKLANNGECINLIPLSTNPNHKIQVVSSKDITFQGKVLGKLSDYL